MGSLGFLTPFDSAHFAYYLSRVLSANNPLAPLYITLRGRRQCKLKRMGGRFSSFSVLNEVCTVHASELHVEALGQHVFQ
jgi:NAD+ kinase